MINELDVIYIKFCVIAREFGRRASSSWSPFYLIVCPAGDWMLVMLYQLVWIKIYVHVVVLLNVWWWGLLNRV